MRRKVGNMKETSRSHQEEPLIEFTKLPQWIHIYLPPGLKNPTPASWVFWGAVTSHSPV